MILSLPMIGYQCTVDGDCNLYPHRAQTPPASHPPQTLPLLNSQGELKIQFFSTNNVIFSQTNLTTVRSFVYLSSLTPITNMGASAEGAEMITLVAPPAI